MAKHRTAFCALAQFEWNAVATLALDAIEEDVEGWIASLVVRILKVGFLGGLGGDYGVVEHETHTIDGAVKVGNPQRFPPQVGDPQGVPSWLALSIYTFILADRSASCSHYEWC